MSRVRNKTSNHNQGINGLYRRCDAGRTGFVDYEEFSKYLTKDALISLGNKPSKTSVMKTDFCSPEQRR